MRIGDVKVRFLDSPFKEDDEIRTVRDENDQYPCLYCDHFYLEDKKTDAEGYHIGGICKYNSPRTDKFSKPNQRFYPHVKVGDTCIKHTERISHK